MNKFWHWTICGLLAVGSAALAHAQSPSFKNKTLSNQDFTVRQLDGADFQDATLVRTRFTGSSMRGAKFIDADLSGASMNETNLTGADFTRATLIGVWLEKADLTNANLADQNFGGNSALMAIFRCANLRNVRGLNDLRMADLRQADLRGANLVSTSVQIYGAGHALTQVQGAKFRGALYDARTLWPQGFDVEASGAVMTESAEQSAACGRKPG